MRQLVSKLLCSILLMAASSVVYAQLLDTFRVYFRLNDARVSAQAQQYMDSLIFKGKLIFGQRLALFGYADQLGGIVQNEGLSVLRAQHVQQYLVSSGFSIADIAVCEGKGRIERNAATGKDGHPQDRMVQIAVIPTAPKAVAAAPNSVVLDMAGLKVNETVALKNINFWGGSAQFLDVSLPVLDALYHFLSQNPTVAISIECHICCNIPEDPEDRNGISYLRAKAVNDYLIVRGISRGRLRYEGFGFTRPLIPHEQSEADRVINRRVAVRILSK